MADRYAEQQPPTELRWLAGKEHRPQPLCCWCCLGCTGRLKAQWRLAVAGSLAQLEERPRPRRPAGGHSFSRVAYATDFTGQEIEKVLISQAKSHPQIEIREDVFVLDLLMKKKECFGVSVILPDNKTQNIFARATVLATGGAGQIFRWTTNPEIATGDGIALAHRAGAKLQDLEFIQFHPTVLRNDENPLFLLSEALRGEGAHLVNQQGERFLTRHHKLGELAPRDIVSRAIALEERRGGVFLDFTHAKKEFLRDRFPGIFQGLKQRGFDLSCDRVPIAPAAHYLCGGVAADLKTKTSLARLFAIGEVAATGVHGANRLASNSLLEAVVFSEVAAKQIIKTKKIPKNILTEKWREPLLDAKINTGNLRDRARDLMWNKVGILRTRANLISAVKTLRQWEQKLGGQKVISLEFAETKNLITVARLVAAAASKRKKSLGTHQIVAKLPLVKK